MKEGLHGDHIDGEALLALSRLAQGTGARQQQKPTVYSLVFVSKLRPNFASRRETATVECCSGALFTQTQRAALGSPRLAKTRLTADFWA
jgi:hypothetical protein